MTGISKEQLEKELASLLRQQRDAEATAQAVHGAIQFCTALLETFKVEPEEAVNGKAKQAEILTLPKPTEA